MRQKRREAMRSDEQQQVERTGRGPSRARRAEARPSEQESPERRSRLLGFGQCLAPANFSSPCGRTTVTFFRSKADRILSSEASPFSKRRVSPRARLGTGDSLETSAFFPPFSPFPRQFFRRLSWMGDWPGPWLAGCAFR